MKIVIKTNIFMAFLCARHCVGTKDKEMRNIIPAFKEFPVQSGRISQHNNYITRQRHGKCWKGSLWISVKEKAPTTSHVV